MRKQILIIFVIACTLIFAGCSGGSYRITIGSINSSPTALSGQYNSFTGYYFVSVKLKEGDTVNFHVSIVTDAGQLTATLIDPSGNIFSRLEKDKSVQINKTGTYKIQVEGTQHKGGFLLTWNNT